MGKLIKLLLFILVFAPGPARAAQKEPPLAHSPAIARECARLLTYKEQSKAIKVAFKDYVKNESSALTTAYLWTSSLSIRNRAERECMERGGCTDAEIAKIVEEIIQQRFSRNHRIRAYTKLVVLNAGFAIGTAVLADHLPKSIAAITTYVTVWLSNLAWEIIAPMTEPFLGKVRQKAFTSTHQENDISPEQTEQNRKLEEVWKLQNKTLNPMSLIGRAASFQVQDLSENVSTLYGIYLQHPDRKTALRYIATQLARYATLWRTRYPDIQMVDEHLLRAFQFGLIAFIDEKDELRAYFETAISAFDPRSGQSSFYQELSRAWFSLPHSL